jgi:superfamily II DNA or RNA helicase
MGRAIISNRIFIQVPPDGPKELMEALTYKIEQKAHGRNGKSKTVEVIRNYKVVKAGVLSLPQGRQDLIPEDYVVDDRRIFNEVPWPEAKYPLREGQQEVYDKADDTLFLNAKVGWGKTFTALHIAKKFSQKTLVITHTTALRDQWVKEIETLFGCKPGIIGSGKFDIEDHFIVVGNVQTVVKMLDVLAKEFGTVIMDEAHHCPATTFTAVIDSFHARYRIALSGTMLRKDGKHIVFPDYFGNTVFKPAQSHTLNPKVKLLKTGVVLRGANWAEKINNLLYDPDYQELIATTALFYLNHGHKVLITGSRVEFLQRIQELIGDTCVLITGEVGFEERTRLLEKIEAGEATCISASRQIFTEGISCNPLSCVILAEPTSNPILLEQLIGRIQRLWPDKLYPLVVDLQFNGPAERRQNNMRVAFYNQQNWEIDIV